MTDAQPNTPSLPDDTTMLRPPAHIPGQLAISAAPPADADPSDAHPATPVPEGAQILADLRAQIKRYVAMPSEEALTAVTLWVAATHLQRAWQHAPRLAVVAPEKRCGKSRLLDVVTETVRNRLITVNASAAAIFRSITDEDPPTLLVDEADTLFGTAKAAEKNEDLRGLLNAGHQRNRPTLRVSGPEHAVQEFPTFAMAALAGIGDLPGTIMDRSVVIRMRRRADGEKVASFRTGRDTPDLHAIRDRLAAWLTPLRAQAMEMEPAMPVEDRAADTWEPLVTIADLAGGEWPTLARTACRTMTDYEAGQDEEGGLRTRLLVGIRRAFAAVGDPAVLGTKHLLESLNADKEAPWADYGANGLTARGLQVLLKPYGIGSANRRFPDGTQAKGFARNQFLDTWARYCPEPKPLAESAQSVAEPLPGTAA
ncbi:DUF3631 domain-containing protein [Streptomyces roseochromogenus]|uniref:DUF3631 domain-containing protein n=1 Tax=Streptomyces roseochromogenus subsp. oscitans DS 12.976 TaxID=1352936 RepID=V6KDU7_STRRC|nr:DUF3631 domain-containing protein [Streptomyces roseochromogenus]EST29626.1 hypothetical protein M878_20055 [Streptomyces roseochromogenus subsp. oscitans DS 12.976]